MGHSLQHSNDPNDGMFVRSFDKFRAKVPHRGDDVFTPATRLLEKRFELGEIDVQNVAAKVDFEKKMENNERRRAEVEDKERILKKYIKKFNKYIRENNSKRARAERIMSEEARQMREYTKEHQELKEERSQLVVERDELQTKIQELHPYKAYLENIVFMGGTNYREIPDILARHATLKCTYDDLRESVLDKQTELSKLRYENGKYLDGKTREIMSFNNKLSALTKRFDEVKRASTLVEAKWDHIQNTAADKTLMIGRIHMGTNTLLEVVKRQKPAWSMYEIDDPVKQLRVVAQYLRGLRRVVSILTEHPTGARAEMEDSVDNVDDIMNKPSSVSQPEQKQPEL